MLIMHEVLEIRDNFVHTLLGRSYPQNAGSAFIHRPYLVALYWKGMCKLLRVSLESIQTAYLRSHPQHACACFVDRSDILVTQTERIIGVREVVGEELRFPVKSTQSAAFRADPHGPLLILVDRSHRIIT